MSLLRRPLQTLPPTQPPENFKFFLLWAIRLIWLPVVCENINFDPCVCVGAIKCYCYRDRFNTQVIDDF